MTADEIIADLRALVAKMQLDYDALRAACGGWVVPSEPCRCGSGGHPRACPRHPYSESLVAAEISAVAYGEREAEVERLTVERDEARAEAERLAEAATTLIESLPRSSFCYAVATRAWRRGENRYCDEHGAERAVNGAIPGEYPRAVPLRALVALLAARGAKL